MARAAAWCLSSLLRPTPRRAALPMRDLPNRSAGDRFRAQLVPDVGNARAEHLGRACGAESVGSIATAQIHVTKCVRGHSAPHF